MITCEGFLPAVENAGRIRIGRRLALRAVTSRIEFGAVVGAELSIGDRVFINQGASLVAQVSITVRDDVRIGDYVAVYDSNFHQVEPASPVKMGPVVIEAGAWIGRGAVILPGVTIGRNAVVAAGSIVRDDVAAHSLVAGQPAKFVRQLDIPDDWVRK